MTAKISAIIAQYINKETRLIIPEVGTLIRRKESGEIIFMDMLKKNDGTLIQLIVNALDVSPSKATEIVNRYIGTVKQQLESNKKFILDGVGVILVRPEGGMDFSFNPFAKSIPEPTPSPATRPAVAPAPRPQAPAQQPKPAAPAPQPKPQAPVQQPKPQAPAQQPKPQAPAAPAPQPKPAAPAQQPKPQAPVAPKPAPKAEEPAKREQPAKRPIKKPATKKPQPKVDLLTIVAILAAVMALVSIFWGFSASSPSSDYDEKMEQRKEYQQPVTLDEAIDSKSLYQG
ncbi:MAG: hypothetical protein J6K24_01220 [Tidjanibacter sp.]|nr:hypothetical protein [Tidjanibacter sp.]